MTPMQPQPEVMPMAPMQAPAVITGGKQKDLTAEVLHNRRQSLDWMSSNFYGEWEKVYQNYLCYRSAREDDNDPTVADPEKTSVALPDTWGWVSRLRARMTAQIPNIRFRTDDQRVAELISRSLMYQWDRGGAQKPQKKHVLQTAVFGWSVKAWWWDKQIRRRRKRIDPFRALQSGDMRAIEEIVRHYQIPPEVMMSDPSVLIQLMQQHGRGQHLPIEYDYCAYEGPRSTVLFPGDCYPEPGFTDIQESGWFMVERRHGMDWIESAAKAYPEFGEGFEKLLRAHPKGTPAREMRLQDHDSLYTRLKSAVGQTEIPHSTSDHGTGKWTFTEVWKPGAKARWTVVAEDSFFIGDVDAPFDLDGKIPFTECVLIDNLMHGIGDSTARVIIPLQEMHNRQVSQRYDVVDRLLRPNVFTADVDLFNNPDRIKSSKGGFRLILSRHGAAALQLENMGPALSAVAAALQDESSLMRMMQVATGDSNMSMAANVDPSQTRTATGARLAAFNQDVLTKDLLDRYTVSLAEDAEIMFLLNRSELGDAVHFEASVYNRTPAGAQDTIRERWVSVEPELFNRDGMLTVETGSTLADDDEANVQKAQMMFSMFNAHPLVNQEVLRDEVLKSLGKGADVERFAAPPPPPPPPEDDTRKNISLSIKFEELPDQVKAMILTQMVLPKDGASPDGMGAPSPAPPPGASGGGAPPTPPPAPPTPDSAAAAAAGAQMTRPEMGG